MKRFTIPCLFGEKKHPVHFYLGDLPLPGKQVFTFQGEWFAKRRQAKLPEEIAASFMKLAIIAKENKTSFEELAMEALGASSTPEAPSKKAKKPFVTIPDAASGQKVVSLVFKELEEPGKEKRAYPPLKVRTPIPDSLHDYWLRHPVETLQYVKNFADDLIAADDDVADYAKRFFTAWVFALTRAVGNDEEEPNFLKKIANGADVEYNVAVMLDVCARSIPEFAYHQWVDFLHCEKDFQENVVKIISQSLISYLFRKDAVHQPFHSSILSHAFAAL